MNRRRSLVGWLSAAGLVPLLAIVVASLPAGATLGQTTTTYTVFNSPNTGSARVEGSEELDLVLTGNEKFAVIVGSNEGGNVTPGSTAPLRVRAVRLQPPAEIVPAFEIRTAYPNVFVNGTTSDWRVSNIALHPTQAYAIVTLRDAVSANPTIGRAIFVNIDANTGAITKRPIGTSDDTLALGVFPDSIEIAPNGQFAVVANSDETLNSAGTIQVLDLRGANPTVVPTAITPAIPPGDTLPTTDPQPETVAIAPDNSRAFVSLQPNNAITVVDINPTSLAPTATTLLLGRNPANNLRFHPDGLHVADIAGVRYLVTADEGWSGPPTYAVGSSNRPNSVSMYRVDAGPALTRINSANYAADTNPQKLDFGTVGGALRVFASLGGTTNPGQLAVLGIAPSGLTQETIVNLVNPADPTNIGQTPVGVAIGPGVTYNGVAGDIIVVGNRSSQNVSVVFAQTTSVGPLPTPIPSDNAGTPVPTASPGGPTRTFLPLAQK